MTICVFSLNFLLLQQIPTIQFCEAKSGYANGDGNIEVDKNSIL